MDDVLKGLAVLESILDGSEKPRNLPLAVLRGITQNFSEERKIGQGGCGDVYMGILRNGAVAVKKLFSNWTMDDKMFHQEVTSMMLVNHPNTVRFLGFCSYTEEKAIEMDGKVIIAEVRERLLCFEYISNGSLDDHLNDELRGLEWKIRYEIIKGVCAGLNHLHKDKHIIHMDLKPANILLDDQMVPKITDFGLSRPEEKSRTMSANRLLSLGYCAPEYLEHGRMSLRSDIYSLGVIIIEIVTGSKEDPSIDKVLRRWRHRWSKSVKYTPSGYWQITECLKLAQRCKHRDPKKRPDIWDIIQDLSKMDSTDGHDIDSIYSTLGQDMLRVEPLDLHFPFEPTKQIIRSLNLTNDTMDYIAFSIRRMSPLRICVQPDKDVIAPQSNLTVTVTLEGQVKGTHIKRHELHVWSTTVDGNIAAKDIPKVMFDELTGNKVVDEVGVTIVLDAPSLQPEQNLSQETGSLAKSVPPVFLPGAASVSLDSESPAVQSIGVCYGMQGDNLPSPSQVVQMYWLIGIKGMRLYHPHRATLDALRNSGIGLILDTGNNKLVEFASNPSSAASWVQSNVQPYYPAVNIKYIAVGNEVCGAAATQSILPALHNINNALAAAGLSKIKVSTSVGFNVIADPFPPSSGRFFAQSYMVDVARFLESTNAPLLANVYPYFAYTSNHNKDVELDYATFQQPGTTGVRDSGNGLSYNNLFDAMVDAIHAALEKAGAPDVRVVVSETGWPSAGGVGASIDNARRYNQGLIDHVGQGTPKKPQALETFIFAMFNENHKMGSPIEKNFGLFYPDKRPVYPVIFPNNKQYVMH